MGLEQAKAYLRQFGADERVIILDQTSATVKTAAEALHVAPEKIAKTLAFSTKNGPILVVAAGDARMDNRAFKDAFGEKMRLLKREETEAQVGHPIGGVCPFGVKEGVRIFLDESLKRFDTVYPACGSVNSAIAVTVNELEQLARPAGWVDLGKKPASNETEGRQASD